MRKKLWIAMLLVVVGCGAKKEEIHEDKNSEEIMATVYESREYNPFEYVNTFEQCIQTEEDAIAIVDIMCKSVYPEKDFSIYEVMADYSEEYDMWHVYYLVKMDDPHLMIFGGGGPEVNIRASNGEVTFMALQQ